MPETSIEWTDFSINPIRAVPAGLVAGKPLRSGHYCEKVSPGCANCYASAQQPRFDLPTFGSGQHRDDVLISLYPERLQEVLRRQKPTRWFWCDMTDMFGSWVEDIWLDACFATMALTSRHTHQVLTKRPERMRAYLGGLTKHRLETAARALGWSMLFGRQWVGPPLPLPNVWCGVSVEDDAHRGRVGELMRTPAAVRFVSAEPLLGPLQLAGVWAWNEPGFGCAREVDPFAGTIAIPDCDFHAGPVDWVIVGGESGRGARPCNVGWIRSIVDQCKAAGVPCFVKQLGARPFVEGPPDGYAAQDTRARLPLRVAHPKGGDPAEWSSDLRVREFPPRPR